MFDLKRFRKDFKLKQEDLAADLSVRQSFISQVETGKDQMPDNWIDILKQKYSIDNISSYIIEDRSTGFVGQSCKRCEQKDKMLSELWDKYQEVKHKLQEKDKERDQLCSEKDKEITFLRDLLRQGRGQEGKANTG